MLCNAKTSSSISLKKYKTNHCINKCIAVVYALMTQKENLKNSKRYAQIYDCMTALLQNTMQLILVFIYQRVNNDCMTAPYYVGGSLSLPLA